MEHILKPLEAPFTPGVEKLLEKYPRQEGYLLKLFATFANSERFLQKGMPNLLDKHSPLTLRQREIVILRLCANRGCEYEWGVHVSIFASHARLTDAQVAATLVKELSEDLSQDLWNEQDHLLLQVVDQLCTASKLNPQTLKHFRSHFDVEQQLEIFALCGAYSTVSYIANNAELPLETFAETFAAVRVD